ncbi:MAG TPA: tetratricopeptide repeat protein [Trueperaceae bacterium]|nr:tetratricopeptide repeat protein [Trueperaceae bacterium]
MIRGTRRWSGRAAFVALAAMLLLTPVWGQSVAQLRAEVEANPDSVVAWVALGNAYYDQGEFDLAKENYLEAIALDYTSGDAHYGLGLSEFSRGDYQAALFEFTEVTRLYPERFDGQFNRAVTLARLRQPAEAAKAFAEAIAQAAPEASPADRVQAQLGLAAQLELSGDWEGAAAAYAAALELEPNNADYILRRGQALYKAGKGLEALPELTALEANSGDYRVSALISDIYVGQGQIDYGVWSLERALQKAEKANDAAAQSSTLVKLGTLQRGLGRDTQARDSFERAVLIDPASWEAQYNLGVTLLEGGQTRESIEPLRTAQKLDPNRAEVYLALATAYDQVSSSTDALSSAREAISRLSDPKLVTDARLIAGRALYRTGDYAAASAELQAVLADRPNDAQVQLWAGLAAYQQGDYAAAVRNFERAVQLDPGSTEARVNLGAGYLAAQRYEEAENVYGKLVKENPDDSESIYNLGWSLYSQDRRGGARDAWVTSCQQGYQPACNAISNYL